MPIMNSRIRSAMTLILLISAITFSGLSAAQETQQPVDPIRTATVKEMQIAGSYVYLLVVEDGEEGEEVWLATTPGFVKNIKYGDVVEFQAEVEMQDFHSNGLDRTFASLWFVSRIRVKQEDEMEADADENIL